MIVLQPEHVRQRLSLIVQDEREIAWKTPVMSLRGARRQSNLNETRGKLTVRGIHPLRPFPADDGAASTGQVELKWTPPDPCTPGQPVPVDVYFTDDLSLLQQFSDPGAIQIVAKKNVTSVVVQTQPKTRYYWAVDSYVGSDADLVLGPIFSFVSDNLPPAVDAGADVVTWLKDNSLAEDWLLLD